MHPDLAPSRRRSWLRRTRLLVEGLVLGGAQILLLSMTAPLFTEHPPVPLPLLLVGVLSVCSYLIVTLSESFLTAARAGTLRSRITTAWRVAGISILPIVLPAVAIAVLAVTSSVPEGMNASDFHFSISRGVLVFILFTSLWVWVWSTLGGWIGGIVGQRGTPGVNQSSLPAAHQPLSGPEVEGG